MKVSFKDFNSFLEDYYHTGKYEHQRLGQGFMNTLLRKVNDPDLFYQRDDGRAIDYILQTYVEEPRDVE